MEGDVESKVLEFREKTGGLSEGEWEECLGNSERLRFCIESKWFDATGEKDEKLTDAVSSYLWKKQQQKENLKDIETEIISRKKRGLE